MVTRSTLDPLEEARALVRLRYQRGKPTRAPMNRVGLAAERIGRKAGTAKLPPLKTIARRWRDIVGEQLYGWCQPEKLTTSKDGRVLTLTVLPQAALIVQHQSETIRQRVSIALGGDIVAIRLNQGQIRREGTGTSNRRTTRPLTAAERLEIEVRAARCGNARLRAAIVALGTAVLSAEK